MNKFLGFKQQTLADDFVMPFGKHKGKLFKDLDIRYLKWLITQDWVKENMIDKATEIISAYHYKLIDKKRAKDVKEKPNPCYKCGTHVSDLTLTLCANCAYDYDVASLYPSATARLDKT